MSSAPSASSTARTAPFGLLASLSIALGIGALLRLAGLERQILIGDELHTLNGAISRSVGEILRTWTYGGADYCVPLTAAFSALHAAGAPLSELVLRTPSLIAGLATIALFPLALRARIGAGAASALALLLATSPMLVLYARIVRSYAIVVLLGGLAVLAFDRYWRTRDRRFAAAWAVLAPLACWFHLVIVPFVAAPLAVAAFDLARTRDGRRARELALVGAGATAGLALLLGPAAASIFALTSTHRVGTIPSLAVAFEVARMHSGSLHPAATIVAIALGLRGALLLWFRDRAFFALLACVAVAHVVGLFAMSPDQLQHAWVLNRYLLPLLPFELALIALGCTPPAALARIPALVPAGALALALLATGPLAGERFWRGTFVHSIPSVSFVSEGNVIPRERMPGFYRELASHPGGRPILEFPWHNIASHAFEAYQHWHGRDVLVSSMDAAHGDPSLGLRNVIAATPEAFLASRAQYAVVHVDLRLEESLVPTSDGHHWRRLGALDEMWTRAQRLGRQMARLLEQRFGPPVYADDMIRVFDLDAARAARESSSAAPAANAPSIGRSEPPAKDPLG